MEKYEFQMHCQIKALNMVVLDHYRILEKEERKNSKINKEIKKINK